MSTKDGKHSNSAANALFRATVDKVEPLKARDRHQSLPAAKTPRRKQKPAADAPIMPEMSPVETGEALFYKRDCVNQSTIKQLRRGKIKREAATDLHGMTSAEAHQALQDFLSESRHDGLRCVRVVHGKGLGSDTRWPVLKNGVNKWLRQWDDVLAFCSASNNEGGTGAVWVLLRAR